MKTLLKKVINDEALNASAFNFTTFYLGGKLISMVASVLFDLNLNQYNSIDHLSLGVGIGTFAYKKSGGGKKGILAGLVAATFFNFGWEGFEYLANPYNNPEHLLDTLSDIAVVYSGSLLGSAEEKFKDFLKK